jgi:hypothetical protein
MPAFQAVSERAGRGRRRSRCPGRAWLAEQKLPHAASLIIDDDTALTGALDQPITAAEGQRAARAGPYAQVKVLTEPPESAS